MPNFHSSDLVKKRKRVEKRAVARPVARGFIIRESRTRREKSWQLGILQYRRRSRKRSHAHCTCSRARKERTYTDTDTRTTESMIYAVRAH
jgi:hypothetical protein